MSNEHVHPVFRNLLEGFRKTSADDVGMDDNEKRAREGNHAVLVRELTEAMRNGVPSRRVIEGLKRDGVSLSAINRALRHIQEARQS